MLRSGQGKNRVFRVAAAAVLLLAVFAFAASRTPGGHPSHAPRSPEKIDALKRLIAYPGKHETACPPQTVDMAVLLVIGQSNAANSGETRFATHYPSRVFSYFNGQCTIAASPLLGATGAGGEFATPLADRLIADGTDGSVVLIAAAIGSSEIARWQQGGDLNDMLLSVVRRAEKDYRITGVVWHQGENDFPIKTSAAAYAASFRSLLGSLKSAGVAAPVFIAVATKCGEGKGWNPDNPVAAAQKTLADNAAVFLAADTDTMLGDNDRRRDGCHFRESGQLKTAFAYARAIRESRRAD